MVAGYLEKSILLIGDSHAEHLATPLIKIANKSEFNFYLYRSKFIDKETISKFLIQNPNTVIVYSQYSNLDTDFNSLMSDLNFLSHISTKVIIFGQTPAYTDERLFMNGGSIATAWYKPKKVLPINHLNISSWNAGLKLKEYALNGKMSFIDPTESLCDKFSCWRFKDGKWLYFDDDHLSIYGANLFESDFLKYIK